MQARSTWLDYLGLAFVVGVLIWFASIVGCAPLVVHPSPGLALCPQACDMLERLECPEGESPACTPDCERLSRLGYVWRDDSSGPQCVVESDGTVDGVRSCNVRCELEPQFLRVTSPGHYHHVDTLAEAHGIRFECPLCRDHQVMVWFRDRNIPVEEEPTPRWAVSGTGIDDLTLSPSINVAGCWHGFVHCGAIR